MRGARPATDDDEGWRKLAVGTRSARQRGALAAALDPRAVAVVGASERSDSVGAQVVRNLIRGGYDRPIYPINPHAQTVAGLPARPDVSALPDGVDLVVLAVRAERAADVVKQLRGIAAALVLASGFAETGPAGAALERDLLTAARSAGVRLIGPNCQGLLVTTRNLYIGFGSIFDGAPYPPGELALVSQSGGFGFSALLLAAQQGVRFGTAVSTGNEADVTTSEIVGHLLEVDHSSLVCAYVETLREPATLLDVGTLAARRGVPVAVWKVGRSMAGRRAASTHTGRLMADYRFYDGLLHQAGMLPIATTDEMIDLARAFAPRRRPRGKRLGVLSISGGAGVLLCDHAERAGLQVPRLSAATRAALARELPGFASDENPVDVTAHALARPELLREPLAILARDDDLDMLCVLAASMRGAAASVLADAIAEVAGCTSRPILLAWTTPTAEAREHARRLESAGVACFPSPERLVTAAAALSAFDPTSKPRRPRPVQPSVTISHDLENESDLYPLLAQHGIPVAPWRLVSDEAAAVAAADELGYPVVAKGQLRGVVHKSELGLVRLGIHDADALRSAYRAIRDAATTGPWSGLLVQRFVADGLELIVSGGHEPGFGPYVMAGLGGVFTEVLDDVGCAVPPLSEADARSMLQRLRGHRLLAGVRGAPPRDVDALAAILVRLGDLVLATGAKLIELNPVLVLAEGRGCCVVDAVFQRGEQHA